MVITGTTGNRVYPKRVPRVQIPPAPPEKNPILKDGVFFNFAAERQQIPPARLEVIIQHIQKDVLSFFCCISCQYLACSQIGKTMIKSPGIYANMICEVVIIRKNVSLLVILMLLLFAAPEAGAASLSSKAGAVTTSSGFLNVRSQASSGAPVVASLKKGSYITLISKSGVWWKVEYEKGKYGYCHSDYITIVEGTPVTVTTGSGSLNVRSGPGTSYARTASLGRGEVVLFLKASSGWSRVLYHGTKTGYVSAQYLSNYYRAVSLKVPSFKQNDDRWGSLPVAQSGKTMAQIGCATTAIAMMESFRTGSTIYPDEMMKKLSYTASGNVYWPSYYKTVANGAGYLESIYSRLTQGRPVLLGCRDTYGKQHWVVVTGYTGGTDLRASGFTIHDPGTWSRTNLQQFISVFPTFYKYFYY